MPCSTIGYRATDLSLSLTRIEALHNCIYEINGQTNKQNYTNFKSNLAMMVIYLPVKFEFDWTKRFFELESGNRNVDRQTNGQTSTQNYTNCERNLPMIVGLTDRCQTHQSNRRVWLHATRQKMNGSIIEYFRFLHEKAQDIFNVKTVIYFFKFFSQMFKNCPQSTLLSSKSKVVLKLLYYFLLSFKEYLLYSYYYYYLI